MANNQGPNQSPSGSPQGAASHASPAQSCVTIHEGTASAGGGLDGGSAQGAAAAAAAGGSQVGEQLQAAAAASQYGTPTYKEEWIWEYGQGSEISANSGDTLEGPPLSPLMPDFDPKIHLDRNPPGRYPMPIGTWVDPRTPNQEPNVVWPFIDAAGRLAYEIVAQDTTGRQIPLPRSRDGRRNLTRASPNQQRANLTAAEMARGYFAYEPQYAADPENARQLIAVDIANYRWQTRQTAQIAAHAARVAAHPPPPPQAQSWEDLRGMDQRSWDQEMGREMEGAIRRARRRLVRRHDRRRDRLTYMLNPPEGLYDTSEEDLDDSDEEDSNSDDED